MSSVLVGKCPVCTAPLSDSQKWQRSKTTTIRSNSSKRNASGQDFNRSNLTQQSLSKTSTQNLESDYIKQLQEQIYLLETECIYLRDQLNKNSSLINRSLNDDRLHRVEQERSDLQRNLVHTSSHYDQLSSEKHGLTIALDELRQKFDREKQNLLDELDMLRKARETFEQDKHTRDQELRQIRERLRLSSDELKNAQTKIRALEQQLEQQLDQNRNLNDEIRSIQLETNSLQRSLNDYQLANRERDRLQTIVNELENEVSTLRQELKSQDTRYNEAQFLRNKLTDEKGALMKEISRLENLTKEFERELDQLRHSLRERGDNLQSKERELAGLRKKEQTFYSTVESLQAKLEGELARNRDLDGQLKHLQHQFSTENQNYLTIKRELADSESRSTRLQDQIHNLQREKDQLTDLISTLQQRLASEQGQNNSLRNEIRDLEERVKEIDRLKSLEDLIQSQRWDDISQMAQTMQSVSRTMARATSPTSTRRRIELQ